MKSVSPVRIALLQPGLVFKAEIHVLQHLYLQPRGALDLMDPQSDAAFSPECAQDTVFRISVKFTTSFLAVQARNLKVNLLSPSLSLVLT